MKTYYHTNTKKVCQLLKKGAIRGKGISCWKTINNAIGWMQLHKGYEILCIDVKNQVIKRDWSWGYIKKENIVQIY